VSACFFFSSRRRHTRFSRDWSSDVCSSDLSRWTALSRQGPTSESFGPIRLSVPPKMPTPQETTRARLRFYRSCSTKGRSIRKTRSEERRVGKECRARRGGDHEGERVYTVYW